MLTAEVIITDDGSTSLFVPSLNETYHSRKGALTESVHVYIKNGLYERIEATGLHSVDVLEIGLGTGLNALLAIIGCLNKNVKLNFTAIEPFPLAEETVRKLNYSTLLSHPHASEWFSWIHDSPWGSTSTRGNISLTKHQVTLESFQTTDNFDVVFFDAFAPEKQPEIWSPENYRTIFSWMNELGILTTYCAKGQVKRDLLGCGFIVEKLPGAPGKREMLRAIKPPQNS